MKNTIQYWSNFSGSLFILHHELFKHAVQNSLLLLNNMRVKGAVIRFIHKRTYLPLYDNTICTTCKNLSMPYKPKAYFHLYDPISKDRNPCKLYLHCHSVLFLLYYTLSFRKYFWNQNVPQFYFKTTYHTIVDIHFLRSAIFEIWKYFLTKFFN